MIKAMIYLDEDVDARLAFVAKHYHVGRMQLAGELIATAVNDMFSEAVQESLETEMSKADIEGRRVLAQGRSELPPEKNGRRNKKRATVEAEGS